MHHLQGHLALEQAVDPLREPDRAHAAAAQQAQRPIRPELASLQARKDAAGLARLRRVVWQMPQPAQCARRPSSVRWRRRTGRIQGGDRRLLVRAGRCQPLLRERLLQPFRELRIPCAERGDPRAAHLLGGASTGTQVKFEHTRALRI
ncbi:MAG: hypothetical protein ABI895_11850 [Deltaproteobacteria bacterium]